MRTCEIEDCERPYLAKGMCRLHYDRVRAHGDPTVVVNWRGLPLEHRFWLSVERGADDECWEWQRTRDEGGYGRITDDSGHIIGAHRASWALHIGPVPDGMHVLHHCDNRPCVNPDHLWLGTNADNVADKVVKGRAARGAILLNGKALTLTVDDVLAIRSDTRPTAQVAADYGISSTHTRRVRAGLSWAWVA